LSYAALPAEAQQAFAQLGVFVGDFPLDAAQAVVAPASSPPASAPPASSPASSPPPSSLPDTLSLLRRRSLLEYDAASERYDLHDLARAFALARLEEWGMENAELRMTAPPFSTLHSQFCIETRLRHARYYQQAISNAQFELYLKGKPLEALSVFDRERRQFDAGWDWAREQPQGDDTDRLLMDFPNAIYAFAEMRYDLRRERIPQLEAQAAAARRLGNKHHEGYALGNLGLAYPRVAQRPMARWPVPVPLQSARQLPAPQCGSAAHPLTGRCAAAAPPSSAAGAPALHATAHSPGMLSPAPVARPAPEPAAPSA
jgi:hypothetical protein